LTSFALGGYIVMLRKWLALLLLFSWVIFSGFDIVEDLDLPDPLELHNSADAPSRGTGSAGLLARNIVELADRTHMRCSNLLEYSFEWTAIYTPSVSYGVSKLHKVHQVLLI
jgi:hypothetical protein